MNAREFDACVSDAIASVPPAIRNALDNVAFVVEPIVRRKKAREIALRSGDVLLGLYEGIPKVQRSAHYGWVLPDKITIFQRPIETLCNSDPVQITRMVRETVLHEVGHHLGFGDHELHQIEVKKRRSASARTRAAGSC